MVLRHVLADRRHGCSRICCPVRQTSVSSFLFFDIIPCSPSCRLTRFGNAIYFPLSKIAWGAFLGWITFACMRGIGDVIDMLLSAPIWIPLARMTYSAYLVHPVVLTAYFAAVQNPFHLDGPNILFVYAGAVFISYATAAVLVLFVEMPFGNLEKLAFGA
eukprot:m.377549 g.377549  ORF g.377549 m.377549 type:complete len:160 (-) comp56191_c0_seq84:75-554(-)